MNDVCLTVCERLTVVRRQVLQNSLFYGKGHITTSPYTYELILSLAIYIGTHVECRSQFKSEPFQRPHQSFPKRTQLLSSGVYYTTCYPVLVPGQRV